MKNLNLLNLKSIVQSKARWLLTLFALLTLGIGNVWAEDDTRTVFLDINPCSWYTNDGYYPRIWVAKDDKKTQTYEIDYTEIITTGVYRFEIAKEARCIQFIRYNGSNKERWSGDIWINKDEANSECCYKYHNYFKLDNNAATVSDANKTSFSSSGEYLYFYADNLTTRTKVDFLLGRWNYTTATAMSLLDNTEKLYYVTGAYFDDAYSYFSIVGNGEAWSSGSWGTANLSNAGDYTAAKYGYKFNTGSTYYATKSSSSKGSAVSIESKSGYSAIPKYTTTLNIKVREATLGDYTGGSTSDKPASTIKITGTYMSGNGSTDRSDATWSSASSCSYQTVISGKVTPEYVTLDDNWQFDGWYIGGVSQGTGTSFYFYQSSDQTVEARFTRIKYDVNLNNHGATTPGTTKVLATYGATTSNITVPTKTGYTFGGYYTEENGNGTQIINASGVWQTNNDLIGSDGKWKHIGHVTLHAKWTANTYTITFNINGGDSWGPLGSASESAGVYTLPVTYDQVLNSLTMPHAIKNAKHFKCWSTETTLWEGKYPWIYDNETGDEGWHACDGYVNKDGDNYIWKKADNITLYAHYYDLSIPRVTFSPQYVVPEEDVTATVEFSSVFGNPEGSYTLCYTLTTASGVALQVQPEWRNKNDATHTVKFTAPGSPGDYSLAVKLFPGTGDVCGGASPAASFDGNSDTWKFQVEDMNPITIQYKCGSADVSAPTTARATWSNPATVTAPDIPGLQFVNWTLTSGAIYFNEGSVATDKTVSIKALGSGTLTANYSQGSLFFKDTKGWGAENIYVYFYNANDYWTTNTGYSEGTGSDKENSKFISGPHLMTLLEGTDDVYYYPEGLPEGTVSVAFANKSMEDYEYFAQDDTPCEAVRVKTLNPNKPMIVPVGDGAVWNQGKCKYYAHDEAPILMDWGYNLRGVFNSWSASKNEFKSAKLGDLSFTTTVYLDEANQTYQWKIYNGNKGYGLSGDPTLTKTNPTSNTLENHDASGWNLQVKTNIAGEYTFTLNYGLGTSTSNTNGETVENALLSNMKVTVTYPVVPGDYRLIYTGGTNPHPGNVIKKRANGEDIVSMYVASDKADKIKIQACTETDNTSVTWGSATNPTYGTDVYSAFTTLLSEEGSGVYNFYITQDASGNPKITNVEKYTGRFYVRTNCVNDDKWNYKDSKDAHAMTYSEWSEKKMEDTDMRFSHYYVDDLHGTSGSPINIRFTVATDYSEAICDTVFDGDADGKWKDYIHSESLQRTANVRFTYDQNRNKIWRAYTEGPENDNYMVLRSNGTDVFVVNGLGKKGDASAAVKFTDLNNWVYQADVFANVNTYIKLTADIAGVRQYLRGNTPDSDFDEDHAEMLIGGSSSGLSSQHMRITYDFKTDRMMTSWLPSDPVSGTLDIHADIMLLRTHQDGASSITFNTGGKLTDVKTAYGVMEFQKDYINDYSLSRYERNLYWISFPFDVNLSDVFGFGNYGEHWIIEYYDGKGRAEKGYWAESEPNWKFVTEEVKDEFVLKANEGYILALALTNMTESSDIWANSVTSVYLYFPSANTIGNLSNVSSVTVEMDTVGYKCKITRDNRHIKDSYWRCIGVPSYALSTRTGLPTSAPDNWETKVPYVYIWNSINNSLAITSSSSVTFEAMHSYLIQYPDDKMVWTNVTNVPAGVMRRRVEGNNASFYEWNLNLLNNGQHIDHTYVRLSNDENVTDGYDFGNDLSKEFNSGSNIYTFVDDVEVAGNVKPIRTETTIVPVGVKIATTGEYTFSMPEGTNGVGVILVDNIAGTRTNLALEDYTVNLTQGNIDGRFLLEISPIAQTPTDMENVQGDDVQTNVRKVMVDGILYIVKDGFIYDARGNRIQ